MTVSCIDEHAGVWFRDTGAGAGVGSSRQGLEITPGERAGLDPERFARLTVRVRTLMCHNRRYRGVGLGPARDVHA
jgi:hypothetical protein